ncbi:MAG TPA: hypothetical protein VGA04_09730 [Streptosporangiaceae bacterium]
MAFLQVNADRDQAVRGERVEEPVGELEAARAASAVIRRRACVAGLINEYHLVA